MRRTTYDLQSLLFDISSKKSLRSCCRNVIKGGGGVELRRSKRTGAPYFQGLQRCGSVWLCPVCSHKISASRREEIERVGKLHWESGGSIAWLTLTVRHDAGMEARDLRKTVSESWRAVQQNRAYRSLVEKMGLIGTLRALEVTHGENGFHPHLHLALFFDRPIRGETRRESFREWDDELGRMVTFHGPELKESSSEALARLGDTVFQAWSTAIQNRGYPAPSRERGCKIEEMRAGSKKWAAYITTIGFEFTATHKQGRKENRSLWEVARDAGTEWRRMWMEGQNPLYLDEVTGEQRCLVEDVELWWEYERMISGARQIEWSRKLKKRYAVKDQTDLELVEEPEPESDLLVRFPKSHRNPWWRVLARRGRRAELIEAAWDGPVAVQRLLVSWGIDLDQDVELGEGGRRPEVEDDWDPADALAPPGAGEGWEVRRAAEPDYDKPLRTFVWAQDNL